MNSSKHSISQFNLASRPCLNSVTTAPSPIDRERALHNVPQNKRPPTPNITLSKRSLRVANKTYCHSIPLYAYKKRLQSSYTNTFERTHQADPKHQSLPSQHPQPQQPPKPTPTQPNLDPKSKHLHEHVTIKDTTSSAYTLTPFRNPKSRPSYTLPPLLHTNTSSRRLVPSSTTDHRL